MEADTTKNPGEPNRQPGEPAPKRQFNRKLLNRLGKYAVLLVLAAITLRLVFDCYSYYIARRDIDAELQSKRLGSLEYLNVLLSSERSLSASLLEGRCLQRAMLTYFRVLEAGEVELEKTYAALVEQ